MESKDLNDALEVLKKDLEGKSKAEVKTAIDAFETKQNDAIKAMETSLKDEFQVELKKVQDHADKLDIKLQKKNTGGSNAPVDGLKQLITDNFDEIKKVRKGSKVNIETKAVGDMSLGASLTGDQPRDYSNTVARVPNQLLNFANLVDAVAISGGTYTFPRETGSEGSIGAQVEGTLKNQIDYDLTMVDVNTDFLAGFCVYSKKMANNLPFLESFLPQALRRDYWKAENASFSAVLATEATASTEVITGKNQIEMVVADMAKLEGLDFSANAIVLTPADFWNIMVMEKSTGAGFGLPGFTTFEGGQLRINGIPVYRANWVPTSKYFVGDFTQVKKVTTEGLSVEFSESDVDNFRKNNISARVEAQVAIAVHRPDAIIYGDFTAV